GDLYDQRDRVGELQPAQTHAASRRVPQRRGTDQTAVLGATQHQQEMDDADPRLEGSTEPIYDPIRGKASSAVNPSAGYTKICTPSKADARQAGSCWTGSGTSPRKMVPTGPQALPEDSWPGIDRISVHFTKCRRTKSCG